MVALGSRDVTPGARIDHWSLTQDTTGSPWVQAEVRLSPALKIRGGAGIHRQAPGFEEVVGLRAGTALQPERAVHADVGVERALGRDARLQVTIYHRQESGLLRLPDSEPRIVAGVLIPPSVTSRWVNALDGYARGVELLLQRRSSNGLTGWVSYSFGVNRYEDTITGERFDGDVDQRHTFNAYGMYRVTDRFSLAAKLRIGSNVPVTGYWDQRGEEYFVGTDAQRVSHSALLPAGHQGQSDVQPARQAAHAVRRTHERLRPRQRPVQHAVRQRADATGVRDSRADDSLGAVGWNSD